MAKVTSDKYQIPFINWDTDIKLAEIAEIVDEAVQSGQYNNYTCTVSLPSGTKRKISFNKTSLSKLVAMWGDDTTKWIGKKIQFTLETVVNPKTNIEIPKTKVWTPVK